MQTKFCDVLLLQQPVWKRSGTRRSNIGYSVLVCEKQVQLNEKVLSLVDSRSSPNSGVIVYCRYKDEVDYHARRFGCRGFYAKHRHGEESLRNWLDGTSSVLVATGALGGGINMPNVDLVIHINILYGFCPREWPGCKVWSSCSVGHSHVQGLGRDASGKAEKRTTHLELQFSPDASIYDHH